MGKMETLDEDFSRLSELFGIKVTKKLPHSNQSSTNNYRDLYSQKMKNIISDCFSDDVNLLKYKF